MTWAREARLHPPCKRFAHLQAVDWSNQEIIVTWIRRRDTLVRVAEVGLRRRRISVIADV